MARTLLILGGARSGKSALAERIGEGVARRDGLERVYVATAAEAVAGFADPEMAARIREHQERRGPAWRTVEAPLALAEAATREAGEARLLLVDCLTLWLSNHMLAEEAEAARMRPDAAETAADVAAALARAAARDAALASALRAAPGRAILVSNEVGLGVVPETRLGRRFRDAQGRLNQAVASIAETVIFMAAGLSLTLKGDLSAWPEYVGPSAS